MKKEIKSEKELTEWFKKNYREIGYEAILKENKNSFPDFVMLKKGKKINVEVELKSSYFFLHKHPIDRVDEIVCIEIDKEIGKKMILLPNFYYNPPKAKRINISLDEHQIEALKTLKGFGKKDAEKVKNILMSYLSEKGYLEEFNKKRK